MTLATTTSTAATPMSEGLLWRLYRRLLAEHLLLDKLPARRGGLCEPGLGIAAALTENLLDGDTLGLPANDLGTRYLCGAQPAVLRAAAQVRGGRRKSRGWVLESDAEHGLLPYEGEEQAALAVGTALAARLHQTGGITVLAQTGWVRAGASTRREQAKGAGLREAPAWAPGWADAVEAVVALQLPLLFISLAPLPAAQAVGPRRPPTALPAIPVDRHDALALYRVIYESAARARAGGGPTWIECSVWRLGETGDAAGESALDKMEQALRARKLFDRRQQRHMEESLRKELACLG